MIRRFKLTSFISIKDTLFDRKDNRQLAVCILLIICSFFLEAMSISLVFVSISAILTSNEFLGFSSASFGAGGFTSIPENKALILLAIPVGYLIKNLLLFQINKYFVNFAMVRQTQIGAKLYENYINQNIRFFDTRHTSELIRNVITESSHIATVVEALIILVSEITVLLVLAALVIFVSPTLGLTVLTLIVISGISYYLFLWKRITSLGVQRQSIEGDRLKVIKESLLCINEVKLFQKEPVFSKNFRNLHESYSDTLGMLKIYSQVPRYFLEILMVFLGIATLAILYLSTSSIAEAASIASLLAATMLRFAPSLNRISSCYNTIRFYLPVAKMIQRELEATNYNNQPKTKHQSNLNKIDNITLNSVSFSYAASSDVILKDLDFSVSSGDFIGIVGSSGSGKSTFINVLLGLTAPNSGLFKVDGHEVEPTNPGYRSIFGCVPQKTFLLDGTISQNIAFGVPQNEIDQDRVRECLRLVKLDKMIEGLTNDIQTHIGEDGNLLSGGQNQRLSIARMLYADPQILVLDEATSALDPSVEHEILDDLSNIRGSKPIIFITHRPSALNFCETVYEMTNGRLRPSYGGSHLAETR